MLELETVGVLPYSKLPATRNDKVFRPYTAGPGSNESARQHSVKRERARHCQRSRSDDRISQRIVGLHEGEKEILVVSLKETQRGIFEFQDKH